MNYQIDQNGFYGEFGGAYIPELLHPNIFHLKNKYLEIINSIEFKAEFDNMLINYVGRPSPLYFAQRLSQHIGSSIYLKREDLNHTGSHKINNTLGQILMAKKLNKKRIIAETGAGQHGVATATVCALMNLKCVIYMGSKDIVRQATNVKRMQMLGAEVRPAESGSRTLKDATNEAMRDWINNPTDTYYIIGSVVGPHPYPDMVARFQSVISQEIKRQLTGLPDYIVACVGGGSNAAGAFYHFLDDVSVKLIGVEAAGLGLNTDYTAATIHLGTPGILHASRSLMMQTTDGQVIEPHSISAGLDYPGIGPLHAHLSRTKRASYGAVTDQEAVDAGHLLARLEGIIPALESAHALAYLSKMKLKKSDRVIICLSGRGDKDLDNYFEYINN